LGIRQADLAREVGITRQTIIAIEKGRLNPSILICLKVARLLREPVDYVFYLAPGWDTEEGIIAEVDAPAPSNTRVRVPSKTKRKSAETAEAAVDTDTAVAPSAPDRYDRDRDTEADSVDESADVPIPASVAGKKAAKPEDGTPGKKSEEPESEKEKQGQAIWDFF